MRFIPEIAVFLFAYWFWPESIGSIPFSQLILGIVGEAVFAGCVAFWAIGSAVAKLDNP